MPEFVERQYGRNAWFLGLVTISVVIAVLLSTVQIVMGVPIGTNPGSDALVLALCVMFGVVAPALLLGLHLVIVVDEHAISVRLWPLPSKTIAIGDIETWSIRRYEAVTEFFGWGQVHGLDGDAYTVSGDIGLQLMLRRIGNQRVGSRILIGTRRPDELRAAMRSIAPDAGHPHWSPRFLNVMDSITPKTINPAPRIVVEDPENSLPSNNPSPTPITMPKINPFHPTPANPSPYND